MFDGLSRNFVFVTEEDLFQTGDLGMYFHLVDLNTTSNMHKNRTVLDKGINYRKRVTFIIFSLNGK